MSSLNIRSPLITPPAGAGRDSSPVSSMSSDVNRMGEWLGKHDRSGPLIDIAPPPHFAGMAPQQLADEVMRVMPVKP